MIFFFFKQKTAYEMRISDWISDVCSSDLVGYYYKYEGLQEAIFNPVLISYTVQNAAASKSKGIELQGEASLGGGFVLTGSINYNDSKFTDYIGVCLPGVAAGTAPCNFPQSNGTFAQNYAGDRKSTRLNYSH